jgi:electron transport complex protein RnfD
MRDVVVALVPAALAGIVFFGYNALLLTVASVVAAVAAEAAYQKVAGKEVSVGDWSAVITGILVAFNVPPSAPLWLPVVGSAFAIVVVKQLFGGIGSNFVNPALAARAFLVASWPAHMTRWTSPFDAVSTATPLVTMGSGEVPAYADMFLGNIAGCVGETSALALLIGAGYLLARRVIDWRIPGAYLGTVSVLSWILGPRGIFTGDPLAHLLAGGLLLGAFFMATDYVTSPVTKKGRLYMGIGCGILTVLIRLYGGFPEGVSYSILLMNLATPLIDKFTGPRVFGHAK